MMDKLLMVRRKAIGYYTNGNKRSQGAYKDGKKRRPMDTILPEWQQKSEASFSIYSEQSASKLN